MQLGIIGLGRMGANMARRLMRFSHSVVVYDIDAAQVDALAQEGAEPAHSMEQLVHKLAKPRAVWLMLPAGEVTEQAVFQLATLLSTNDTIIDGGNTYFRDDIRRAEALRHHGIHYIDVGTSGGVWGLDRGYCLMIGGEADTVARLRPVFHALAPGGDDDASAGNTPGKSPAGEHNTRATTPRAFSDTASSGYIHAGPVGSGHFVKMVHNGIEYGMMQALAEGFHLLQSAQDASVPEHERYDLDLAEIAEVWRHGSVITSWLLDLTAAALADDPHLAQFTDRVSDSGEGRWTIQTAIERAIPAPVLSAALFARFRSRLQNSYPDRLLSAMRFGFGGHTEDHRS